MARKQTEELVQAGVDRALELMALAAHNSYRFGGKSTLEIVTLDEPDMEELSNYAMSLGDMSPLAARDGRHALDFTSEPWGLMLLGDKRQSLFSYNCGACGYPTCGDLNRAEETESLTSNGPACLFRVLNLNVAANAAAAAAWRLGLHCRVFSTLAFAGKALEMIDANDIVVSVAVSAAKENPFFDRHKFWTQDHWNETFEKEFPTFGRGFIGAVE